MVSWARVAERAVTVVNFLVYGWYAVEVIRWATGVDVIKSILKAPPPAFEKIVEQYPQVFYALSFAVLILIFIDQFAVSYLYGRRGMPPPKYVLASSSALFSLSLALFLFLRTTPLWPFYLYFMVISGLAIAHSIAMLTGQMKEILPQQAQALYEFLSQSWGPEDIYPEDEVERRRRVLRTCRP